MKVRKDIINVAVVGLGVGEQHAITYSKLEKSRLCLIHDLNIQKSINISKKLGCKIADNFDQIIEDSDIDLISIASFDDVHYSQIISGLEAEKHIFVEKPLCETKRELKLVKQTWDKQKSNVKLSSNLILRAAPIYIWLKEKIASGFFGDIYSFDGDYLYGRLHKITHGWRKNLPNYSAIKGGGIHLIDLMIWLTGQKPISVSTVGSKICTMGSDFKHDDFMASTYKFDSGMIGRITANLGCIHRHHHIMRIFGTKATFIYDDAGPRVHFTTDPNMSTSSISLDTLPRKKGDLIQPFVESIIKDDDLEEHTQTFFDEISICLSSEEALKQKSELEIMYI